MSVTRELAVDQPMRLGSSIIETGENREDGFYTFKYDFLPESMQRAELADLLMYGEQQEQVKFVPLLGEGDAKFHFEGQVELLPQRQDADVECVAVFDGNEWTLQVVSGTLRAKHRPGVPDYNVEEEPADAAAAHPGHATALEQQAESVHEIDHDLDAALDEALFAAGPGPGSEWEASAAGTPGCQPDPYMPAAVQQPARVVVVEALQGLEQAAVQVPPLQVQLLQQEDEEEEEDSDEDDPWNTFSAAPAPAALAPAPTTSQPQPAPSIPAAAQQAGPAAVAVHQPTVLQQPAAPAAAAAGLAAGVRVVGNEEEEEEENSEALPEDSEDESDGVGVEVF